MKLLLGILSLLVAMSFSGCGFPTPRSEYALDNREDLVASNSPTVKARPRPVRTRNGLEFSYSTLFKNTSATKTYHLRLSEARFVDHGVSVPAACHEYKGTPKAATASLAPGDMVRIDCRIILGDQERAKLRNKDSLGEFQLAYGDASTQRFTFKFKLKVEDF